MQQQEQRKQEQSSPADQFWKKLPLWAAILLGVLAGLGPLLFNR